MMVEDAEQPELQNRFVFVDHEFIFLLFKVDILLLHQSTTFKKLETVLMAKMWERDTTFILMVD